MGRKIELYTDGAYSSSKGLGGWGCILHDPVLDYRKEYNGYILGTTNNQMEILAVIKGLEQLLEPCEVLVISDSMYVVNAINEKWIDKWIGNGWLNSARNPVANRELWERLYALMQVHVVSASWVKGHNKHPENERCDFLAKLAIKDHSVVIQELSNPKLYKRKKLHRLKVKP